MGRKSRLKRERRNETFNPIEVSAQSLVVLLLDEGQPIETLLSDPLLLKHLTPQNILGIAQAWQRKTTVQRQEMASMASKMAEILPEMIAQPPVLGTPITLKSV